MPSGARTDRFVRGIGPKPPAGQPNTRRSTGPARHPVVDGELLEDGYVLLKVILHQDAFIPPGAAGEDVLDHGRYAGQRPRLPNWDESIRYAAMRMSMWDYEALPVCTYRLEGLRVVIISGDTLPLEIQWAPS